jgi:hypothetical protein
MEARLSIATAGRPECISEPSLTPAEIATNKTPLNWRSAPPDSTENT